MVFEKKKKKEKNGKAKQRLQAGKVLGVGEPLKLFPEGCAGIPELRMSL